MKELKNEPTNESFEFGCYLLGWDDDMPEEPQESTEPFMVEQYIVFCEKHIEEID